MININRGHVEDSGDFVTITTELGIAISEINERFNRIPDVEEKDIFIKTLLDFVQHLMLGGDDNA